MPSSTEMPNDKNKPAQYQNLTALYLLALVGKQIVYAECERLHKAAKLTKQFLDKSKHLGRAQKRRF